MSTTLAEPLVIPKRNKGRPSAKADAEFWQAAEVFADRIQEIREEIKASLDPFEFFSRSPQPSVRPGTCCQQNSIIFLF